MLENDLEDRDLSGPPRTRARERGIGSAHAASGGGTVACGVGVVAGMIGLATKTRVWIVADVYRLTAARQMARIWRD